MPNKIRRYIKLYSFADKKEVFNLIKNAMAIKDIPTGEEINDNSIMKNKKLYNYSHILSLEQRKAGYKLMVESYFSKNDPTKYIEYEVYLYFYDDRIGEVVGYVKDNKLEPHSQIYGIPNGLHRGKGLGEKMYEALYAQALKDGIGRVSGKNHTEDASKLHRRLTEKHQLSGYEAKQNRNELPPGTDDLPDVSFAPYEYEIK